MNDKIKDFATWLGLYNNLLKLATGLVGAAVVALAFLTAAFGPLVLAVGSALICLIVGYVGGILFHRRYASRRNAPLGYRIDLVKHEWSLQPGQIRHFSRSVTRRITAKRDNLYAIDGRWRTDATRVVTSAVGGAQIFEPSEHDYAGLNHYMAIFAPELTRGESREVRLDQDYFYESIISEPEYVHATVVWVKQIDFRLQFPPAYVKPGTVALSEILGSGVGAHKRKDLTKYCNTMKVWV